MGLVVDIADVTPGAWVRIGSKIYRADDIHLEKWFSGTVLCP